MNVAETQPINVESTVTVHCTGDGTPTGLGG